MNIQMSDVVMSSPQQEAVIFIHEMLKIEKKKIATIQVCRAGYPRIRQYISESLFLIVFLGDHKARFRHSHS